MTPNTDNFSVHTNYKALYDQSPDMYLSIDPKTGLVQECNQTVTSKTGYSRDEIIGQPIFSLYHPSCMIDAEETFKLYQIEESINNVELKVKTKNGGSIPVLLNVSSIKNEEGETLCTNSCWRDISDRKTVEEQFISLNKELEAFSYSVTNGVQKHLKSILGYTEILIEDHSTKMDKEMNRFVNSIKSNSNRMEELLDSLLSYSKIGAKKIQLYSFDLNVLVKDVLSQLKNTTPIKDKFEIGTLHYVNADYTLLQYVVLHLISNAVKFSANEDQPLIKISSSEKADEIVFSVEDNGIGFDPKYANTLFDIFQQLQSPYELEGTGIGLALSKKIVEKHNGRIWAEGKENEGATFYFSIPKVA